MTAEPRSIQTRRLFDGDALRAGGDRTDALSMVRYGPRPPSGLDVFDLVSTPSGYNAVDLWWGTPPADLDWLDMVIVRSGFGHPVTPSDGVIVYKVESGQWSTGQTVVANNGSTYSYDAVTNLWSAEGETSVAGRGALARILDIPDSPAGDYAGTITDTPLPSGGWYYYAQLFRIGISWYRTATAETLVPINYDHSQVMYDQLPPFYQEVDGRPAVGERRYFLKRWFETIGYDLDLTRTLTEGMDVIYDPDRSPLSLISSLGQQNLGFNLDESVGAIRYRSVIAASRDISASRGTYGGLEAYLSSATQYDVTSSPGNNLLLLRDDARFESGVGNWCPTHHGLSVDINTDLTDLTEPTATVRNLKMETVSTDAAFEEAIGAEEGATPGPRTTPDELTRGAQPVSTCLKLTPAAGESIAIACGVGQSVTIRSTSNLVPGYRAHSVIPGRLYHLSFWTRSKEVDDHIDSYRVAYGLAYYGKVAGKRGFSDAFSDGLNSYISVSPLGVNITQSLAVSDTEWTRHYVSTVIPEDIEGIRFACPVIWIRSDTPGGPEVPPAALTPKYVTGVMFSADTLDTVQIASEPSLYLRLSSDSENQLLGTSSQKVLGGE